VSSGRLAGTRVRHSSDPLRDILVWLGPGATRLTSQSGQRAQRRRRPAFAAAADARADRRASCLLFSGTLHRRLVRSDVRPAVESTYRLFFRTVAGARYGGTPGPAHGFLVPGGRTSAQDAGCRVGGARCLASAERYRLQRLCFSQWSATARALSLFSARFAGVARDYEDSPP